MAHVRSNLAIVISNNLFIFLRMKKDLILSYVALLLLTIASALISSLFVVSSVIGSSLMVLAGAKFAIVCFQFMEIKKAHSFWKISLLITLGFLIIMIIGLKK